MPESSTPAEFLRDGCTRAASYLMITDYLLTQIRSSVGLPGIPVGRPAPPIPGNQEAFFAHTALRQTVLDLEEALRCALHGDPDLVEDLIEHVRPVRGGSDGNIAEALKVIPRLAAGLDEDAEAAAALILERRIRVAQSCPDIDEARRHRRLPDRTPAGRPPCCPYCGMWWLFAVLADDGRPSGKIECHTPGCRDGNGFRPVAQMGTDEHGRLQLAWADGTVQPVPDLSGTWLTTA